MATGDDGETAKAPRYEPRSAQRYGGTHSPDGPQGGGEARTQIRSFRDALRLDTGARNRIAFRKRTWLIFAAATPLLLSAFINIASGNPFGMARDFGLFAIFAAGATLIRQGVEAQAEYEAKEYTVAPAVPRKLFGSVLLGGGLFLTGLLGWDIGLVQSLGMGIFGAAASVLAFGLDPMRAKGGVALGGITPQMVSEAVAEANEKIEGIERAAADVRDRPLRERLREMVVEARKVVNRIEEDPTDLRRTRKFLSVYLSGAHDATRKYVRNQSDHADSDIYMKFRALLDEMTSTFRAQHERLLKDDRIDLDIEIDVLAERLKQETAL